LWRRDLDVVEPRHYRGRAAGRRTWGTSFCESDETCRSLETGNVKFRPWLWNEYRAPPRPSARYVAGQWAELAVRPVI
jgi:hypothetical protein